MLKVETDDIPGSSEPSEPPLADADPLPCPHTDPDPDPVAEWREKTEMVECRVKGIQFMSRTACEARRERLRFWTGLKANAERKVCRGCTNGTGVGADPPWSIQKGHTSGRIEALETEY